MKIYDKILQKDPNNIDGLNSKAQWMQKIDSKSFTKAHALYK